MKIKEKRERRHAEMRAKGCSCAASGGPLIVQQCPLHGWSLEAQQRPWKIDGEGNWY